MMIGLFGTTVDIIRYSPTGEVDRYGRPVLAEIVAATVPRCTVQNAQTVERTSDGTTVSHRVVDQLTVYMPPGTDVQPADKLRILGVNYEVQGQPVSEINTMTGTVSQLPVIVKRITG